MLGDGYRDTFDQLDWCPNISVLPGMNLTFALARPKGQEEYRLEGQMLQGGLLDWIKWSLSWCTASKKFQEGMPLLPLGLAPRKLSRRRVRFPSLLMLKGEFPSLSTMGDL